MENSRLLIATVVAALLLMFFAGPGRANEPGATPPPIEPVNMVVGTQTIGASYQFTTQSRLVETAQGILDMGANVIKFSMGQIKGGHGSPPFHSLSEMARDEPSCRKVLDMPFTNYVIWTYCLGSGKLDQNLTQAQLDSEYREIYDFTRYLLVTYNGTGKTFYLGHWEGDWTLLFWSGFPKLNKGETPTPKAIAAMISWLNTRQKAVDDAKRDTPHSGVEVYHYSEVNLVTVKAMQGGACVLNDVIPHTNVDYVSYSSYESVHAKDIAKTLTGALDFIESKLPPKPGIPGRRVFIGEYGFRARNYSPELQDKLTRQVNAVGLQWGTPFILYWEFYNNETDAKGQIGYWMIDDKNVKQPVYYTFQRYYAAAREFIAHYRKTKGKSPDDPTFRAFAAAWFARDGKNN